MKHNSEIIKKMHDLSIEFLPEERSGLIFIGTTDNEDAGDDNQRHYGCIAGDNEALVFAIVKALVHHPTISTVFEKAFEIYKIKKNQIIKDN